MALLAGAYVLGALLFVPAPLLHLVTGFALGPFLGAAVAIPAAAAGACAAFAIGRWLVREQASRLAARTPALAGLDAALAVSGFRVVLLLRLAPLSPFAVLNYLLGATPVRLREFALATVVGSVPRPPAGVSSARWPAPRRRSCARPGPGAAPERSSSRPP